MQKKNHFSCCTVHVDIQPSFRIGACINEAGAAKLSGAPDYVEIENHGTLLMVNMTRGMDHKWL